MKFKKGDRVRVIACEDGDTPVGALGTVIEDNVAPWVVLDNPEDTKYTGQGWEPMEGWVVGSMNCFGEDELEAE